MRPPASRRRAGRGRSWRRLAQVAVAVAAGLVLATVPRLSPAPVQAKTSWELDEELGKHGLFYRPAPALRSAAEWRM